MISIRFLVNIYLAITATYGTVYLSCLVVPKTVEDLLWYVTVDHYSGLTFLNATVFGAVWTLIQIGPQYERSE